MFFLYTMKDTIRIPADQLASNTIKAIQHEIDCKYPNRVLMDVGLVIGRYDTGSIDTVASTSIVSNSRKRQRSDGGLIRVGHGVCVPCGESYSGSCHHECIFQLIVFRPFVNEVCVGRIEKSSSDGIHVTTGFFNDIFIPAYWMLNPSHYDTKSGLWIWTPQYDDDDETNEATGVGVKEVDFMTSKHKSSTNGIKSEHCFEFNDGAVEVVESQEIIENRYEMEIGSEIRFKVKSINFTQITNTAKGMQATTISMGSASSNMDKRPSTTVGGNMSISNRSRSASIEHDNSNNTAVQRIRSSSVTSTDGILNNVRVPSSMQVIGSICEDGLGLTAWWKSSILDEDEDGVFDVDGEHNLPLNDNVGLDQQTNKTVAFKTEDC